MKRVIWEKVVIWLQRLFHTISRFYHNLRILYKLILLNSFLIGIFCVIGIVGVQISFWIYDHQLYIKTAQVMSQFSTGIDSDLKRIDNYSLNLMLDTDVQSQLSSMLSGTDGYKQMIETDRLQTKLLQESIAEQNLTTIEYITPTGKVFTVGQDITQTDPVNTKALIQKADVADGQYVMEQPNLQSSTVKAAREIIQYDNLTLAHMGTLLFSYDLDSIVKSNYKAFGGDNSVLYIYSDNQLIYKSDGGTHQLYIIPHRQKGYTVQTIGGKKYFLVYVYSNYLKWTYVNFTPYQSIFRQNIILRYLMFGSFLLMFFCSVLVTYYAARNITRPLEDLMVSMQYAENGDFQTSQTGLSDCDRSDEIGVLQSKFVMMILRIRKLIQDNYQKQLLIKDAEYRALQSQIEPHFLYNTFSSINWLAKMGRNEDVSTLIMSLSGLLRATLGKKKIIFLEEEVQLLYSYINIQKVRYADRAEFFVDINPRHMQYLVPKLILQPIVENSIKYGVENMLDVCQIRVYSVDAGDNMKIIVQDNGPGMDPDFVEKLNRFESKPKGTGIGLLSVNDRIKQMYGEKYGLVIESHGGVKVTIVMPKRCG